MQVSPKSNSSCVGWRLKNLFIRMFTNCLIGFWLNALLWFVGRKGKENIQSTHSKYMKLHYTYKLHGKALTVPCFWLRDKISVIGPFLRKLNLLYITTEWIHGCIVTCLLSNEECVLTSFPVSVIGHNWVRTHEYKLR